MGNPTVTPLVETFHDGGFIVSLANGHLSFDQAVLTGAAKVYAGTVLGKITASGSYTVYNPANADGSQTVAGILYATKDATAADKPCTVVDAQAEVNASELLWFSGATGPQIATGIAGLRALGIKAV